MIKDILIHSDEEYIESDFQVLKIEVIKYSVYLVYTTNVIEKVLIKFYMCSLGEQEPLNSKYVGCYNGQHIFAEVV